MVALSLAALLGRVHTMADSEASAGLCSEVWVSWHCCASSRSVTRGGGAASSLATAEVASAGGILGVIVDNDAVLPPVCLGDI